MLSRRADDVLSLSLDELRSVGDVRPKVTLSPRALRRLSERAAETECDRPSMRECWLKHAVLGNCRANVSMDEEKY